MQGEAHLNHTGVSHTGRELHNAGSYAGSTKHTRTLVCYLCCYSCALIQGLSSVALRPRLRRNLGTAGGCCGWGMAVAGLSVRIPMPRLSIFAALDSWHWGVPRISQCLGLYRLIITSCPANSGLLRYALMHVKSVCT